MIALRPTDTADEAFLLEVYASTRADELALTSWSDEQKDQFVRMQFTAQDRYYREHFTAASFEVILIDDERVGRLYVDRTPTEIRIVDIALLPPYRGRGIGSQLIETLQAEARARDHPLRIHVERFNPALRLYQRLGFTIVQHGDVYLLMEWKRA